MRQLQQNTESITALENLQSTPTATPVKKVASISVEPVSPLRKETKEKVKEITQKLEEIQTKIEIDTAVVDQFDAQLQAEEDDYREVYMRHHITQIEIHIHTHTHKHIYTHILFRA